jgi:predicted alpha/beta-hydrolase family hydrolase
MDSPFMEFFARGLADARLRVARFEFPYMAERRRSGSKRPPDREDVLRRAWLDAIAQVQAERLFIGGKSLGGRIASLIADELCPAGLICLGYPFHPTRNPTRTRVEHLKTITTPTLIVQGTRDPLGSREEVAAYSLSRSIRLHWLEDGDHSFSPRKKSGQTEAGNWREALQAMLAFIGLRKTPLDPS